MIFIEINQCSFLVIEMQLIEIPEFPILRGEEAKKALSDFIKELEGQKSEELTDKQTKALINFAKGLISSLDAMEANSATSARKIKEKGFVTNLKKAILSPF